MRSLLPAYSPGSRSRDSKQNYDEHRNPLPVGEETEGREVKPGAKLAQPANCPPGSQHSQAEDSSVRRCPGPSHGLSTGVPKIHLFLNSVPTAPSASMGTEWGRGSERGFEADANPPPAGEH